MQSGPPPGGPPGAGPGMAPPPGFQQPGQPMPPPAGAPGAPGVPQASKEMFEVPILKLMVIFKLVSKEPEDYWEITLKDLPHIRSEYHLLGT